MEGIRTWFSSLLREEISAFTVVHMHNVMRACDRVRSIILLPTMMICHSCLSR